MIQTRRERIHSIDAKLYLFCTEGHPSLLNELEAILEEEISDFNSMPEGLQQSGRGAESRDAQACLLRAIKALGRVVDGRKKTQDLMDEIHWNLRAV